MILSKNLSPHFGTEFTLKAKPGSKTVTLCNQFATSFRKNLEGAGYRVSPVIVGQDIRLCTNTPDLPGFASPQEFIALVNTGLSMHIEPKVVPTRAGFDVLV